MKFAALQIAAVRITRAVLYRVCGLCLVTALMFSLPQARAQIAVPDEAQLQWLGAQIYRNECNSKPACLLAWNAGEDFPSLGIGHFIWYRQGQVAPFAETFPDLLQYMQAQGAQLPAWLADNNFEQPWQSRDAFLAAASGNDPALTELRNLLSATMPLQTAFIVSRFNAALEQLLAASPASEHAGLRSHFVAVANAAPPYGLYALIDYVHFKGEGTRASERYQNQGWGLLQVLQTMPATSASPLQDFVSSAHQVLAQRVQLAPVERNEQRWLQGWNNRLDTYLPADSDY